MIVKLQPGDELLIKSPAGNLFEFTFDQVYDLLVPKPTVKKKREWTESGKVSQTICMYVRCARTGEWSNGKQVSLFEVEKRLIALLDRIYNDGIDLTDRAVRALRTITLSTDSKTVNTKVSLILNRMATVA